MFSFLVLSKDYKTVIHTWLLQLAGNFGEFNPFQKEFSRQTKPFEWIKETQLILRSYATFVTFWFAKKDETN